MYHSDTTTAITQTQTHQTKTIWVCCMPRGDRYVIPHSWSASVRGILTATSSPLSTYLCTCLFCSVLGARITAESNNHCVETMPRAPIQSSNDEQMQSDMFGYQDNGQRYAMVNNIPLRTSNEMSHQ